MLTIRALVVSSLAGLFVLVATSAASATATGDEVACRTRSIHQGTTELVLRWEGTTAKGMLQRTAPSGNVTTTNVRAERHDGMIIADDVFETDLVSHAAVVRVDHGKRYMRTDASSPWLACE